MGLEVVHHPGMEFRNDEWALELNPKGTVPFVKDGDLVLNESNTIVSYIANKYGQDAGLYPQSESELALAWQWLEYGETTLAPATNPVFFPVVRGTFYPPGSGPQGKDTPGPEEIDPAVPACAAAFAVLDKHLADKRFVLGSRFTMADVTMAIQANRLIGNEGFGYEELAPDKYPNVVAWHGRLSQRAAFAAEVLPRSG